MDGLVTKIYLGKIIHVMVEFRLDKVMGNHGVKQRSLHLNAIVT